MAKVKIGGKIIDSVHIADVKKSDVKKSPKVRYPGGIKQAKPKIVRRKRTCTEEECNAKNDKTCNQKTGVCVKKTSRIGKKLATEKLKASGQYVQKPKIIRKKNCAIDGCDDTKICNKNSGICVKKTSRIGKRIENLAKGIQPRTRKSPTKKTTDKKLKPFAKIDVHQTKKELAETILKQLSSKMNKEKIRDIIHFLYTIDKDTEIFNSPDELGEFIDRCRKYEIDTLYDEELSDRKKQFMNLLVAIALFLIRTNEIKAGIRKAGQDYFDFTEQLVFNKNLDLYLEKLKKRVSDAKANPSYGKTNVISALDDKENIDIALKVINN